MTDEEKKECFAKDYEFMTNDNTIFWFRKPKE